ncbi:MAG: hypothetical protein M3460_21520 [Actinomycetota bacterium]|nr:hypothetical protein [Actinomycetota bacterium]
MRTLGNEVVVWAGFRPGPLLRCRAGRGARAAFHAVLPPRLVLGVAAYAAELLRAVVDWRGQVTELLAATHLPRSCSTRLEGNPAPAGTQRTQYLHPR